MVELKLGSAMSLASSRTPGFSRATCSSGSKPASSAGATRENIEISTKRGCRRNHATRKNPDRQTGQIDLKQAKENALGFLPNHRHFNRSLTPIWLKPGPVLPI